MKLPPGYAYEGPFIKQLAANVINYDEEYIAKPRTTEQMAFLRLGWLAAHFNYDTLRTFTAVDIGSGRGVMLPVFEKVFRAVKNYDLAGASITKKELEGTDWDLVILNDVLEHYTDIEDLFKLSWRYALISFPETPTVRDFEELKSWRHFRPDEHIYHLHEKGMREWFSAHGARVLNANNFEDILRTRWDATKTNITTMLIQREYIQPL